MERRGVGGGEWGSWLGVGGDVMQGLVGRGTCFAGLGTEKSVRVQSILLSTGWSMMTSGFLTNWQILLL